MHFVGLLFSSGVTYYNDILYGLVCRLPDFLEKRETSQNRICPTRIHGSSIGRDIIHVSMITIIVVVQNNTWFMLLIT